MLVLSRNKGQTIEIEGGIEIEVLKISGNQVRLGIRAPREIQVLRGELVAKVEPLRVSLDEVDHFLEKQETFNGGE